MMRGEDAKWDELWHALNKMRLFVILAALFLAPCAAAQNYEAAPVVTAHRDGDGGVAEAAMDVSAPPSAVWAILSDCAKARTFMRSLLSCRVLERGDGWDVREHRSRGWLLHPVMRNVSRITLEANRRLSFRLIEGDWTRSDGEWTLTPIDGGRGTHVTYRINAAVAGGVPIGISQSFLVSNVRATLAALRREAEQDSAP
ncbi:MAG: SRPBCC family protein [Hyphomonadaceae bacterium]|nr:SRPBCC family protein [Hyphomonadaceae bacterium]MCA8887053.1 SRPBCC family protein [Hyphomonadaceae bacterium]